MTEPRAKGRKGSQFGRAFVVAASLALASCVPTVTYRPSPGSFESAQRALAAERTLSHPPTAAIRESNPDFTPVTFCTAEGLRIVIHEPRLTEDGICGQRFRLLTTAVSPAVEPERCWSFAEISTVGQPRDATTFGYFPVRGYLPCRKR